MAFLVGPSICEFCLQVICYYRYYCVRAFQRMKVWSKSPPTHASAEILRGMVPRIETPRRPLPRLSRIRVSCTVCRDAVLRVTEAVYRLRYQRSAIVSIHAKESQFVQVPCLAPGRLVSVRIFHHGYDSHEHRHSHDEGSFLTRLYCRLRSSVCLSVFLSVIGIARKVFK